MRYADQTPSERLSLLLIDETPDRVITYPLITSHAARVLGVSVREYATNAECLAEGQIAAWQRYRHDALAIFTSVGLIAEAFGSALDYPDEDIPFLDESAFERGTTLDDLETAVVTDTSWLERGHLAMYLDAVERCHEAIGDRVLVITYVPAPFTTAAMLMGVETFLMALIEAPERAQALLALCADLSLRYAIAALRRGGLPMLVDPLASGSVIGREYFRTFVQPHTRTVLDALRNRYDLDTMYHVCGRTEVMLSDLGDCGAELVSLDQVDLARANDVLGERVRLIGNLSPSLLLSSDRDAVREATATMMAIGRTVPKGFVAATGCEVPIDAPRANIHAFIDACREHGRLREEVA